MAEDDIYGSKRTYEFLVSRIDDLAVPPGERKGMWKHLRQGTYWVKNRENLMYIRRLIDLMEADDLSYIRRKRNLLWLRLICHYTEKDLKDCDRDDIITIVAHARKTLSPDSHTYFIQRLKYFWKKLLPDKDERGRIDDTVFPYVVRHLHPHVDKSKERMRKDDIEKRIRELTDAGIEANLIFMLGLAGETAESMAANEEFILGVGQQPNVRVYITINTPHPGDFQWNHSEKLGLRIISGDINEYTHKRIVALPCSLGLPHNALERIVGMQHRLSEALPHGSRDNPKLDKDYILTHNPHLDDRKVILHPWGPSAS